MLALGRQTEKQRNLPYKVLPMDEDWHGIPIKNPDRPKRRRNLFARLAVCGSSIGLGLSFGLLVAPGFFLLAVAGFVGFLMTGVSE